MPNSATWVLLGILRDVGDGLPLNLTAGDLVYFWIPSPEWRWRHQAVWKWPLTSTFLWFIAWSHTLWSWLLHSYIIYIADTYWKCPIEIVECSIVFQWNLGIIYCDVDIYQRVPLETSRRTMTTLRPESKSTSSEDGVWSGIRSTWWFPREDSL